MVVTPTRTGSAASAGVEARTQLVHKAILNAIDFSLAKGGLAEASCPIPDVKTTDVPGRHANVRVVGLSA
jgi:hypothetical protein